MSYRSLHRIYSNKRTNERTNEKISDNEENNVGMDTNEATIASKDSLDTGHVEGTSTVVVPKPKKSKRVSNREVTTHA